MKCKRCQQKLANYESVVKVYELHPDPWTVDAEEVCVGFAHLTCPEVQVPWGPGDEI